MQKESKKFFEGKKMPGFKVGDRFELKGVVFKVTMVTKVGIQAVPVEE